MKGGTGRRQHPLIMGHEASGEIGVAELGTITMPGWRDRAYYDADEWRGSWDNLNHPYIEVEDTAVVIIRFKNGAIGNILVSNSQKPGIYRKVHGHGTNGASVGVQTDGGAMFIAGMTGIAEPP